MYLQFFGLREEPFGSTPDPRFLFASAAHREALASLQYSIETGRGFVALIAPPGMGKTTLLYQVLEKYQANACTAFLFNTQCDSHEFLRFLLSEVGVDEKEDLVHMHRRFNDVLLDQSRRGRRFILIVDEAQNLSSEVLETIRLLSNLETPRAKLMQIILAGQAELDATLNRPELAQLLQRISMISRLSSLTAGETGDYVRHRLAMAGYRGEALFSDEAIAKIAQYSHGIPRLINSICFNVLSLGYASGNKQINEDLVMEAVADLPLENRVAIQAPRAPLYSGRSGFRVPRARVVGMPSKPLIPRPTEVQAAPLPVPAPSMQPQAAARMIANSPAVVPDPVAVPAAVPALVQLSSNVSRPEATETPFPGAPLPQLSAQRSAPATQPNNSLPNRASECREQAPVPPDLPAGSAAPVHGMWYHPGALLRKAAPALLILACLTAGLMVRHRAGTGPKADPALSPSGNVASTSFTAPAPASAARPLALNIGLANAPRTSEKYFPAMRKPDQRETNARAAGVAAPPATSGTAEDLLQTPAAGAPAEAPKAPADPKIAASSLSAGLRKTKPPTERSDVVSDTAVIHFPEPIQRVSPEYPLLAGRMNASGEVVLIASVNEDGKPEDLRFVQGNQVFRQAAIDAASQWKYRPGTYNGKPVRMPVKIHLKFSSRELKSNQGIERKEGTE